VIYISFLAIAESPELWREFHDENLIFTHNDFKEPGSSKLFGKLRKVGSLQRLAATLEAACLRDPLKCPYLLDLVPPPSKLPSWVREASEFQTKILTREAQASSDTPLSVPPQSSKEVIRPASTLSWWRQTSTVAMPASTAVSDRAPNVVQNTAAAQPSEIDSRHFFSRPVLRQALHYAVAWLVWVWLWFPALFVVLRNVGMPWQQAAIIAPACYLICCQIVAYWRLARAASQTPRMMASGSTTSVSIAFVGNRISQVYHVPTCAWANKIRPRNVVSFASAAQATGSGFRPCGVCRP
jgi:hypothetical protein